MHTCSKIALGHGMKLVEFTIIYIKNEAIDMQGLIQAGLSITSSSEGHTSTRALCTLLGSYVRIYMYPGRKLLYSPLSK